MSGFGPILERALARVGEAGLEARLPAVKSAAELRGTPDDRYLSLMSLRIFRAGLKHSVVDGRWPAFEEVFHGFEPARVRAMSDEDIDRLQADTRLIRHFGKLRSVRDNAAAMIRLREERGGMGPHLAAWPVEDVTGLWADLSKRFSQLGGNSAPVFLRMAGRDTFIFTDAVVRGLVGVGVLDGPPKTARARQAAEAAFNAWARETGRPLAHLSMILAASVD
ncbi:MAG TPA: DNA-3-methyladenine glycosylase I [Geminicoccaceae bacterium]